MRPTLRWDRPVASFALYEGPRYVCRMTATPAHPAEDASGGDGTRRTALAAERTWLAWWRTGLGASAVAIGVGRILPGLPAATLAAHAAGDRLWSTRSSGPDHRRTAPEPVAAALRAAPTTELSPALVWSLTVGASCSGWEPSSRSGSSSSVAARIGAPKPGGMARGGRPGRPRCRAGVPLRSGGFRASALNAGHDARPCRDKGSLRPQSCRPP